MLFRSVTRKITKTTVYRYEGDLYVQLSYNEENIIIDIEFPSTSTPLPTIEPSETMTPSSSPEPTATPIVFKMNTLAMNLTAQRASNTKIKLTWKKVKNASGYNIFRSTKEKSGYKKIKTIKDPQKLSYTNTKLNAKTTYYYKIRAYEKIGGKELETEFNEPLQVSSKNIKVLQDKLKKIKKTYKDGLYWNHAGYNVTAGQSLEGFITNTPCNHSYVFAGTASTCNYYIGKDKIKGYQCWGFASLLSDKLFGNAKINDHKSFKKAKVGDHVRIGGHSVLIIEKHAKYIIVAECNYGNTCIIKWGRKIKKSQLKGATYYTRY